MTTVERGPGREGRAEHAGSAPARALPLGLFVAGMLILLLLAGWLTQLF